MSAQRLTSTAGKTFDYTNSDARILFSELRLPTGGEHWNGDQASFWNAQDDHAKGKRKDARCAKSVMVVLPYEPPPTAYGLLVDELVRPFVDAGLGVEIAIHDDGQNPHVHFAVSNYEIADGVFATTAYAPFRNRTFVHQERRRIAGVVNALLQQEGSSLKLVADTVREKKGKPSSHRGPQQQQRALSLARAKDTIRPEFAPSLKHNRSKP